MDRLDFPRPDFIRKAFQLLDGQWDFSFDRPDFGMKISVPFSPESKMSGIGDRRPHEKLFYRKTFSLDPSLKAHKGRILLHFLAVDYTAKVELNGKYLGTHTGGYTPFFYDVTDFISSDSDNILVVEAEDTLSPYQRRGKQGWKNEPFACWYHRNSGIWQSVYLEAAGDNYLVNALLTPSYFNRSVSFELLVSSPAETEVVLDFYLKGKRLGTTRTIAEFGRAKGSFSFTDVDITDNICWSPSNPALIDVKVTVLGRTEDVSTLYFGLRDISSHDGQIYINRDRVFLRLVLDQGLWEDSLLTPPSIDVLRKDIEISREIGFNGARKHQKIECPAYYTMCDELGFLVWEEFPSDYCYSSHSCRQSICEFDEAIRRDYNHPSVMAWVPLNESWGTASILSNTQQQDFARLLLTYIRTLDPTRLVSMNDGWEMGSETDIVGIHDYRYSSESLEKYIDLEAILERNAAVERQIFYGEDGYNGQPILLTEFGGIAFTDGKDETWGYFGKVSDDDDFIGRIKAAVEVLKESSLAGYCYTQLTDVFQETNGLVDMNRRYKVSPEALKSIFSE